MIALAGIVVRNSIILIDFIERIRIRPDTTLTQALIEAGAIRLRPIFLTAGAAMFGALVIILDPIFFRIGLEFYLRNLCFNIVFFVGDSSGVFFD